MNFGPRFTYEEFLREREEPPSLTEIYQKALDNFRSTIPNVVMLGESLRENSSMTKDAVRALIQLLISMRRKEGNKGNPDVDAALMLGNAPEEIRALLRSQLQSVMLEMLAKEQKKEVPEAHEKSSWERLFDAPDSEN